MKEEELVLSDTHLHVPCTELPSRNRFGNGDLNLKVGISRYLFVWPHEQLPEERSERCQPPNPRPDLRLDEDGDLNIERRHTRRPLPGTRVLTIEHTLASPLSLVGLQVWSGALLLCDYLLHIHREIAGRTILELGGGTGLCSIVAALFGHRVIFTDFDWRVLQLCRNNFQRNLQLISQFDDGHRRPPPLFRKLDLTKEDPFYGGNAADLENEWTWVDADSKIISETKVLLAADVIYENRLTDGLFSFLQRMLLGPPKRQLFLTLERRLNFTLEKLDVSCPAYDHFMQKLEELRLCRVDGGSFTTEQLPTDFPRHFSYECTKYLELWKICCR